MTFIGAERQTNRIFFDCFLRLVRNTYYVTATATRMLFCENEHNVKSCNIKIHLSSNTTFFPHTSLQLRGKPSQFHSSAFQHTKIWLKKKYDIICVEITQNCVSKSNTQHVLCTSQPHVSATST